MSQQTWTYRSLLTACSFSKEQAVSILLLKHLSPLYRSILFALLAFCFSGCCSKSDPHDREVLYSATPSKEFSAVQPPAFHIHSGNYSFNNIGTPEAVALHGQPEVQVNPNVASLYFYEDVFKTEKGTYTNHIYRLHFPEVPFSLCRFNITAGKNPGLLIIYTTDQLGRLVLITTVHTCGCYLTFFPTVDLAKDALPDGWPGKLQSIFGYDLPSVIPSQSEPKKAYTFTLASETHRVTWVSQTSGPLAGNVATKALHLRPMVELHQLPYQGGTVSFFETEGRRAGYVKNNSKPLERLLISWWAFDWYVGEDKAYGLNDFSDTPFYTSLKFWQRENSDMKNFSTFLSYWGWKL